MFEKRECIRHISDTADGTEPEPGPIDLKFERIRLHCESYEGIWSETWGTKTNK